MDAGLVLTLAGIAAVDSLNPGTIAEASVLASARRPVRAVLAYWAGALSCYLAVGVVLTFGPAEALAGLVGDPPAWLRAAELLAGLALLAGGVALWRRRHRLDLAGRMDRPRDGVAFWLGVLATVGDLPTAVPYFAAVTLVADADVGAGAQLGLLGFYNVIYLAPVLGVLALRLAAAHRAERLLGAVRSAVERWAPATVAVLLVALGAVLAADGAAALV